MEIFFAALIPTRHRPESLRLCLEAIYSNGVSPVITIVGDDSIDTECIQKNQKIVSMFCNCFYLSGKCKGPSQNRKDLIDNLLLMTEKNNFDISHVACIDDDIIISNKWFENASKFLKEDHARIPVEHHIIYGPIGSRNSFITICKEQDKILTGCFCGSKKEFLEAVEKTHSNNNHAQNYKKLIDFIFN